MGSGFELPALPFVIEPVRLERVQLWSEYAVQNCFSSGCMFVVSFVFGALYDEASCVDRLSNAVSCLQSPRLGAPHAIGWFDLLFSCLQSALSSWSFVVSRLSELSGCAPFDPWCQDAVARVAIYTELVPEFAEYVALCCAYAELPLPQYVAEYFVQQRINQAMEAVADA